MSSEIYKSLDIQWKQQPLMFHFLRTEVTAVVIPAGSETFETGQLFIGDTLPIKLLVALPKKSAYDGSFR